MGGDNIPCFTSEDELSSLENDNFDYPTHHSSYYRDGLRTEDEDESISGSYEFVYKDYDEVNHGISSNIGEFDGNLRRRKNAYNEIMRNYDQLWVRKESLYQAKRRILSYSPGSWISNADGKKFSNCVLPKTTTLLLIGPKGSGKSSLVNRISRVFEDDKFASERAQVTYNPSTGEGTYFLQEYMIPRGSTSFCLFDTRSLSENLSENDEMLQTWMTKGVRHGELVIRDSDNPALKMSLKCKSQQSGISSGVLRKVDFVIFVVNGFQVLRSMNSDTKEDRKYMDIVTTTFSCPYLSFKDDKPAIVVTHGDLLSLGDRARVRVYLGEKLGVPPAKQIFDLPDNSDPMSELMMVDMIRYSLEHADKNFPCKESTDWVGRSTFFVESVKEKVFERSILTLIFAAMLLGIACIMMPMNQFRKHNDPPVASSIKWSSNEAQHSYKAHESFRTYQSNSESTSANLAYKSHTYKNSEPQATSAPTFPSESVVGTSEPIVETSEPVVETSEPLRSAETITETTSYSKTDSEQASPSKSAETITETTSYTKIDSEQSSPSKSAETITETTPYSKTDSEQALPSKSAEKTSEPTLPSKNVADYRHKRKETRSKSPENRHPKAAVKWHKIRHLWLDSD